MQKLQVIEIRGQRVLTTKQIAELYATDPERIKLNYRYNKERYIVGKHIIPIEDKELRDFKARYQFDTQFKYAKSLYLWTEKGALLHAKSLNTDKAWEVYDYLVDFYFRAKEIQEPEKKTIVPTTVDIRSIPDELPEMAETRKVTQDAISVFKILMRVVEAKGMQVKSKDLVGYKSHLCGNKIAVRNGLTLEAVNYEIAFELFHATVNYDQGNMLNTPLTKYYNSQAERAAALIITLLNAQIA
ncbi:MAG: ORF6N domain-containing protein [Lachnospiraceae bacterium]